MFTKKDENNLFIKSIVLALMKKGKVYTVKVITSLRGHISRLFVAARLEWMANVTIFL